MSAALIRYVLIAALRDRLVLSFVISLLVGASLAIFLGGASITEQDYFTLVFTASGLRLIAVMALTLFVVFFVRRSFDNKDIEFLLSRPIGRLSLVSSYAMSFSIISIFMALAVALVVYAVSPHLFGMGHILWVCSITVEMIIMALTAFFFAMYLSSAAGASMVIFGFYVLGRMMGQVLGIIDSPMVESNGLLAMALQMVSVITPRFDLLGQTSWLLYGVDGTPFTMIHAIVQGVLFSALVLLATSLDFVRRQF